MKANFNQRRAERELRKEEMHTFEMEGDIAEWQEWMKQLPTEWKLFLTVKGSLSQSTLRTWI
jgi:hypothetical protein